MIVQSTDRPTDEQGGSYNILRRSSVRWSALISSFSLDVNILLADEEPFYAIVTLK